MPHVIDEMLEVIRTHLEMDVAFVSTVAEGSRTFTHVAAGPEERVVVVGASHALEHTYCTRVLDRTLAPLVPDVSADAALMGLAVTEELGIRAYCGVPVVLDDGSVYGTLCAFSHDVREFSVDDAHALELAAGLVAHRLDRLRRGEEDREVRRRALVDQITAEGVLRAAFQPIVDLRTGCPVGYEALARFEGVEARTPEDWFAVARRLGFDVLLQRRAAATALARQDEVPAGRFVAVNLSERALLDEEVQDELDRVDPGQLVIELTENHRSRDDPAVADVIGALRDRGVRVAIDDVGAGYSGLRRVLEHQPDVIKLDRDLVVGVGRDPARQAMVGSFASYGRAVGAAVVGEGVETAEDADALRVLGVTWGQGFLLGRPDPAPW